MTEIERDAIFMKKGKYTYNIIREVAYGIDAEAMFCNKQKEGDEKKKQERALRSL